MSTRACGANTPVASDALTEVLGKPVALVSIPAHMARVVPQARRDRRNLVGSRAKESPSGFSTLAHFVAL